MHTAGRRAERRPPHLVGLQGRAPRACSLPTCHSLTYARPRGCSFKSLPRQTVRPLDSSTNRCILCILGGELKMKPLLNAALAGCLTIVPGCTSQRSAILVHDVQQQARTVQYNQIKQQLARSLDHPYEVPSLVLLSGGTTKSTSNIKGTFTRASAPTGITRATGFELGGVGDEALLTISVTSGATAVQGMRDLYAYAGAGDKAWEKSIGAFLINRPPLYPWLYRSSGGTPQYCGPKCYQFWETDGTSYWAKSEKDLSDFTLAVLEASTFSRADAAVSAPKTTAPTKPAAQPSIRRLEPSNQQPTILIVPN